MKKLTTSLVLLLLTLCFLLCGCENHGATMISAGNGDVEISVNVFQLYLSRAKGRLHAAGDAVNDPAYWATYTELEGEETRKEYYTKEVLETLRYITAALLLYEELGLELSDEVEASIDEWIEDLIDEVGEGSETKLNSVLQAYGANVTVLRDAWIMDAKVQRLKDYLYGENGSLLSSSVKEEFYQKTYYRGYQMLYANYYFDYIKDAEGNVAYFEDMIGEGGSVAGVRYAYDRKNGVGTSETDKYGHQVYRIKNEDGTLGAIAYNTTEGRTELETDDKGEPKVKYYTDEQMKKRYEELQHIAEECKGDAELFLAAMEKYSDNLEFNAKYAPNGMYFPEGVYMTDTVFYTFSVELAKLEIGEMAILNSDTGYYLIMRVDLDEGAWSKPANNRWFQMLEDLTIEYMLQQRLKDYLPQVTVDESLRDSVDITMVAANNYY